MNWFKSLAVVFVMSAVASVAQAETQQEAETMRTAASTQYQFADTGLSSYPDIDDVRYVIQFNTNEVLTERWDDAMNMDPSSWRDDAIALCGDAQDLLNDAQNDIDAADGLLAEYNTEFDNGQSYMSGMGQNFTVAYAYFNGAYTMADNALTLKMLANSYKDDAVDKLEEARLIILAH